MPLTLLAGNMAFGLGQRDAGEGGGVEELEQRRLLGVVGAGGITRGRADAAVFFPDDVLHLQVLGLAVAGELAGLLVHQLGEGLGEAVAQGLGEDGVEVVGLGAELSGEFLDAMAGRDSEAAEIVDAARILRGNEVGQAVVELAGGLLGAADGGNGKS